MKNNLQKISQKYNKTDSYFSSLKMKCPDKFNYIASFDKDFDISMQKYAIHVEDLMNEMCNLYYRYENRKNKLKNLLVDAKAYNCTAATVRHFEYAIFNILEDPLSIKIGTILGWVNIKKYIIKKGL